MKKTEINIEKNDLYKISYIKASKEPLSADVGIVETSDRVVFYDVGSDKEVLSYINSYKSCGKKRIVVISHFHVDHLMNISEVQYDELYIGKETYKYIKKHEIKICEEKIKLVNAEENVVIDNVLGICEIPNSHCKGSLILNVFDKYTFMGDSIYPKYIGEDRCYNVSILYNQLKMLNDVETEFFLISHKEKFIISKKILMSYLKSIYDKREANMPTILDKYQALL